MQFFFRSFTHLLTRTQGEKLFLVKIASQGTSLIGDSVIWNDEGPYSNLTSPCNPRAGILLSMSTVPNYIA